jgi:uncharacterized protein YndB with AHSA1/START domain
MDHEVTVTIAAPPRRVWTTLTDVEHMPEWTESMSLVQRLDDGPLSVGCRVRIHQPKMRPMVWTVTEFEPERSFTWTAAAAGIELTARHDLRPEADAVSARLSLRVTGWLALLIIPAVGPRIRRYLRMEAEGLKRAAESERRSAGEE